MTEDLERWSLSFIAYEIVRAENWHQGVYEDLPQDRLRLLYAELDRRDKLYSGRKFME